jgi:hypothetical protein
LAHPPSRRSLAPPSRPSLDALTIPPSPPDARFDDPKIPQGSCGECRRVQAAAQAAAANASAAHCGPSASALEFECDATGHLTQRDGVGAASLPGASLAPLVAATAAGASAASLRIAARAAATHLTLPGCAPVLRWRRGSAESRLLSDARPAHDDSCRSYLTSLARRSFGVRMPQGADAEAVRLRGLTPSVALAYGLVPCLGKAVPGEQAAAQHKRPGPASSPSREHAADRSPPHQQRHSSASNHMLLGARASSLSL